MPLCRYGLVLLAILPVARSQSAQPAQSSAPAAAMQEGKQPRYDVVSVREAALPLQMGGVVDATDSMTHYIMGLRSLVSYSYSVQEQFVFGGPKWADSIPFDIIAKITDSDTPSLKGLNWKDRAFVLQPVLAERFGLKVHREQRNEPVYELVVAKGGPKLQSAKSPDAPDSFKMNGKPVSPGTMIWSNNQIRGIGVGTDALASNFVTNVGRVVLDKTGLKGSYDFVLKWTPPSDSGVPTNSAADNQASSDADLGQTFFGALRDQLGLELKPAKAPMDVIVIDDVHMPTAN